MNVFNVFCRYHWIRRENNSSSSSRLRAHVVDFLRIPAGCPIEVEILRDSIDEDGVVLWRASEIVCCFIVGFRRCRWTRLAKVFTLTLAVTLNYARLGRTSRLVDLFDFSDFLCFLMTNAARRFVCIHIRTPPLVCQRPCGNIATI